MNSAYPSPCDAGYYSDRNRSRTSSCFSACPEGYYCPPGTAQPIECPANTYRGIVGARNESDCEPCRPNMESESGSRVCQFEACPAGFYSRNGKYSATTCERCIERPPPVPSSPASHSLFMHPAPLHCDLEHPAVSPHRCPKGTFASQNGSTQCTPCPVSEYQDRTGQDKCEPCAWQMFARPEGAADCTAFDAGTVAWSVLLDASRF